MSCPRKTPGILLLLVLSIALAAPPVAAEVDWDRVKSEWKSYSTAERATYRALMEQEVRRYEASAGATGRTPADTCDDATYEITSLPFSDSGDTQGLTDGLNLAAAGNCAGGGTQFVATGTGPEIVYRIRVNLSCDLAVQMTPTTSAADLAIYVVTNCGDLAGSCAGVSDGGGSGVSETLPFSATANVDYFVVVDGWNGAAGSYDLQITETSTNGCELVDLPVRVQSFSID